jgi:hypothetical protein
MITDYEPGGPWSRQLPFAVRCRWVRVPKWSWLVVYGRTRWPSYSEWLVPGTFGHL